MNTEHKRAELIEALMAKLPELEEFGAPIAAAHLQAAIDALRKPSDTEQDWTDVE
ncbi:hypothetical protein WBP06_07565 [Novosphingobium sp. BL-8H]|uniref:hypothetical protein n=1 Tax=Novosphingobium sp. BL-8H TaxID=3127640 RepID=UPI00375741C7